MFGIVATGSGFSGCSFLLCSPAFFREQKPPFWRAKRGFLACKKGVFVFRMRNHHEINELRASYDDVEDGLR
mgnify:CR=1 FL=1